MQGAFHLLRRDEQHVYNEIASFFLLWYDADKSGFVKEMYVIYMELRKIESLQLYIPHQEDGWFYVKMVSDPETMAYNAPWFPPDGCIPNPEEEWKELYDTWRGPGRFYAFLRRTSDGCFVGDVNYHYNPERDWYDMGIVIFAPERGKGYGKQGLQLLLNRAFRIDGIPRLHNDFETTRDAAYSIHRSVGFREAGTADGCIHLELTRDEYLAEKRDGNR